MTSSSSSETIEMPAVAVVTLILVCVPFLNWPQANAAAAKPLEAFLPPKDSTRWRLTGETELYGPENLYEYCNGAAENYLSYGFRRLAVAQYATGRGSLVVELYDQGETKNAFGLFGTGRHAGAKYISIGSEAMASEESVDFWQGRHYVSVCIDEPFEGSLEAAKGIASYIADRLPAAAPLAELGCFPQTRALPRSATYVRRDFLGQSFLTNAFVMRYDKKAGLDRAFFAGYQDDRAAQSARERFRDYLKSTGSVEPHSTLGAKAFSTTDKYYGVCIVFCKGRYVCGGIGISKPESASGLLRKLAANLPVRPSK